MKKRVAIIIFIFLLFSNIVLAQNHFPLQRGNKNDLVRKWQKYLNKYVIQRKVDGVFGQKTKQGTRIFQSYVGLRTTGIVDKKTWREMNEYAFKKYIVKTWDTLDSIAEKFNLKSREIKLANIKRDKLIGYNNKIIIPIERENLPSKRIINLEGGKTEFNINKPQHSYKSDRITKNKSHYKIDKSYIYPVKGSISSGFGIRQDPINNKKGFHNGVDFAIKTGTKIRAIDKGKVLAVGWIEGFGKTITIDHNNGIVSLYGHNKKLLVRKNEIIKKGETIALSGSTGRTTGPHLHFSIYVDNKPVNPIKFIKNNIN